MHRPGRGFWHALTAWVPFSLGGSYRYFTGSFAYVLHRVTGLGLVFFIFFHILSITKATAADPSSYDLMIRRMQDPDFKLGEIMLYAALLFHGINGIRILLIDFVIDDTHRTKALFWALTALILVLLVAGTVPLVLHTNVQAFFADHLPGAGG